MRARPRFSVAIATAAALFLAAAAQASTPAPVRASGANEMLPAAGYDPAEGTEVLTWSRSRPGARSSFDAYLQQPGSPAVKLNLRGTAWSGDVDVSQHRAVYQQARGGDSKIKLYDWISHRREAAPELVNTPAWEFHPRLQGTYLLFGRETWQTSPHVYRLMLFNFADGTIQTLDSIRHGYNYGAVIPGQVNGDWVVWERATDYWTDMRVVRYNLVTHVKESVPVAAGHYDYGPSVTNDGTVFFVRSRSGCGWDVRIRSFTGEGTALVYALPDGTAADYTYAEERPGESTQLIFNQLVCTGPRENWNIYRLLVEDGTPPPAPAVRGATAGSAMGPAPAEPHALHH